MTSYRKKDEPARIRSDDVRDRGIVKWPCPNRNTLGLFLIIGVLPLLLLLVVQVFKLFVLELIYILVLIVRHLDWIAQPRTH